MWIQWFERPAAWLFHMQSAVLRPPCRLLAPKNLSIFKGNMPLFAYISISKLTQAHYATDRPTEKAGKKVGIKGKNIGNIGRHKKDIRIHGVTSNSAKQILKGASMRYDIFDGAALLFVFMFVFALVFVFVFVSVAVSPSICVSVVPAPVLYFCCCRLLSAVCCLGKSIFMSVCAWCRCWYLCWFVGKGRKRVFHYNAIL